MQPLTSKATIANQLAFKAIQNLNQPVYTTSKYRFSQITRHEDVQRILKAHGYSSTVINTAKRGGKVGIAVIAYEPC